MDLVSLHYVLLHNFKPLYQTTQNSNHPIKSKRVHVVVNGERRTVEFAYQILQKKEEYYNDRRAKNLIRVINP
jgi:muramidase (phage lysozyme)